MFTMKMVAKPLFFFADMFFIQRVCDRWQYGYFHPWTLGSRRGSSPRRQTCRNRQQLLLSLHPWSRSI